MSAYVSNQVMALHFLLLGIACWRIRPILLFGSIEIIFIIKSDPFGTKKIRKRLIVYQLKILSYLQWNRMVLNNTR